MAQLTTMRQRIKAIETTRKITHAMRLIAMSSHSRLRQKKVFLEKYKNEFQKLWLKVKNVKLESTESSTKQEPTLELVVLVSSQKGLCGNFNTALFKFFEQAYIINGNTKFITIGKYAADYLRERNIPTVEHFNTFNSVNFIQISRSLTNLISHKVNNYKKVLVFSNYPKTFFVQKPQITQIWPLLEINSETSVDNTQEDYLFEQPITEVVNTIKQYMLTITIEELLFGSLLAEQSARFVSMDNSTRNAENLLNAMKLDYNKLRQAKITLELTELSSSY